MVIWAPNVQVFNSRCQMSRSFRISQGILWMSLAGTWLGEAQTENGRQTMRPVIRGKQYAATSMRREAPQAAERILRAGGNAFDAIVAGQAVLSLTDAAGNGIGSDAGPLGYDSQSKKRFFFNWGRVGLRF